MTLEQPPILVTHMVGPMWSVDTRPILVDSGSPSPAAAVLAHVASLVAAPGPWPVHVTDGHMTIELMLGVDGSVAHRPTATPPRYSARAAPWRLLLSPPPPQGADRSSASVADRWVFPARTFAVPAPAFVGVHAGAGTSTWSALLDAVDHGLIAPETGILTAVCRATPAALNSAKALVGRYGVERFGAVLVVADAPGRALPAAARGIKVLASAVPVVEVPWIVKLRGLEDPRPVAALVAKPVQRVRDQLASAQVRLPPGFTERTERGPSK
jgi:hypothetical protein